MGIPFFTARPGTQWKGARWHAPGSADAVGAELSHGASEPYSVNAVEFLSRKEAFRQYIFKLVCGLPASASCRSFR
jgi:hypothetical protein